LEEQFDIKQSITKYTEVVIPTINSKHQPAFEIDSKIIQVILLSIKSITETCLKFSLTLKYGKKVIRN